MQVIEMKYVALEADRMASSPSPEVPDDSWTGGRPGARAGLGAKDGSEIELFFFKQKTAYEIRVSLVGSEMCIRDSVMKHSLVELMKNIRARVLSSN